MQEEQENQQYYKAIHQDYYKIQDDMQDPFVYLSRSDLDTIYFDQAMKEPERQELLNAYIREVKSHCELKHWNLLSCKYVLKGQPILDSIWAMQIKRDIVTRQVYR